MKLLIIDPLTETTICNLKQISSLEIEYCPNLEEHEILDKIEQVSILIMRTTFFFTEKWLDRASKLQAVIVAGNGTENVPINLLRENNIILRNIKDASVNSVAEYAVCLILMGLRNITQGIKSVQKLEWKKNQLIGNELKGKTIGLIGFGNIGKAIANLLQYFEVTIIYTDTSVMAQDSTFEKVELNELSRRSDVICIQVPLTNTTKHLINDIFMSFVKKESILINLSRYEIVNMNQLINQLKMGTFKHVYIDPIEKRHLRDVLKFKNLPISFLPHLGANTYEAQERVGKELINIIIELTTRFSPTKEIKM